MANSDKTNEPDAGTLAEISALADGSLDPRRARAVRERVASSPELSERYEREQRAVRSLQATRSDYAPSRLRARIEADRRRPARPRARLSYGGAFAAAAVAAVVAIVLLLPGGTPGSPSVSQAAALGLRAPTGTAPTADATHPGRLRVDVDEVYFPDLSSSLGMRAIGQRTDTLDGHQAVTVYYAKGPRTIAYTIVDGSLRMPVASSGVYGSPSVHMRTLMLGTRWVIAWRRAGDTCVVSGNGPSKAELAAFAG